MNLVETKVLQITLSADDFKSAISLPPVYSREIYSPVLNDPIISDLAFYAYLEKAAYRLNPSSESVSLRGVVSQIAYASERNSFITGCQKLGIKTKAANDIVPENVDAFRERFPDLKDAATGQLTRAIHVRNVVAETFERKTWTSDDYLKELISAKFIADFFLTWTEVIPAGYFA
jgi:hypothetical protein